MKLKYPLRALAAGLVLGLNMLPAHALLHDRGAGLLYDDVLNVTWLQDANYAKTSGYDADGKMDWASANNWAANLVYHDSVRNVDYSDWRLAKITDSSIGDSEFAHMYYGNLGLKSKYTPVGGYQADFGIFRNGTYNGVDQSSFGQTDIGLVKNLQAYPYWLGTQFFNYPDLAWGFVAYDGSGAYINNKPFTLYAWAVRTGDVAAVPVPAAAWLFSGALASLVGATRHRVFN